MEAIEYTKQLLVELYADEEEIEQQDGKDEVEEKQPKGDITLDQLKELIDKVYEFIIEMFPIDKDMTLDERIIITKMKDGCLLECGDVIGRTFGSELATAITEYMYYNFNDEEKTMYTDALTYLSGKFDINNAKLMMFIKEKREKQDNELKQLYARFISSWFVPQKNE